MLISVISASLTQIELQQKRGKETIPVIISSPPRTPMPGEQCLQNPPGGVAVTVRPEDKARPLFLPQETVQPPTQVYMPNIPQVLPLNSGIPQEAINPYSISIELVAWFCTYWEL